MEDPPIEASREVAANRLALTLRRCAQQVHVPRALDQGGEISVIDNVANAAETLAVQLATYLACDHLVKDVQHRRVEWIYTWEDYASWWQHTKAEHFPTLSRWLRRPPRMATNIHEERQDVSIHLDRYAAYPDAPIYPLPPEQYGEPIIIDVIQERDWTWRLR